MLYCSTVRTSGCDDVMHMQRCLMYRTIQYEHMQTMYQHSTTLCQLQTACLVCCSVNHSVLCTLCGMQATRPYQTLALYHPPTGLDRNETAASHSSTHCNFLEPTPCRQQKLGIHRRLLVHAESPEKKKGKAVLCWHSDVHFRAWPKPQSIKTTPEALCYAH